MGASFKNFDAPGSYLATVKEKYLLLCRSLKYFTGMNMWEIFIKN